ncbi:MAG: hypothetical protein FJ340_01160 [Sphingomonadales bacterium]|nr:hypothetical protein [Sphingomonadales bacterium]
MKRHFLILALVCFTFSSCKLWHKAFPPKPRYGVPIGAEKIISGDPDAAKQLKKQRKFKY